MTVFALAFILTIASGAEAFLSPHVPPPPRSTRTGSLGELRFARRLGTGTASASAARPVRPREGRRRSIVYVAMTAAKDEEEASIPTEPPVATMPADPCSPAFVDSSSSAVEDDSSLPEPGEMRLREIQSELTNTWRASYADCFDRESLTRRLIDARAGKVGGETAVEVEEAASCCPPPPPAATTTAAAACPSPATGTTDDGGTTTSTQTPLLKPFDRESTLVELRTLRVKELRTRLSARKIRWGNMIEKEDLVRALTDALEAASEFSRSGALSPGTVADVSGEILDAELKPPIDGEGNTSVDTPLFVDAYATWCGPCQMVAPQLESAASGWYDKVRVAKIDSDKHPAWCSEHKVGAFPCLMLFDVDGKEVDRVEGALMEDGLKQFVGKHFDV